jgi:hypothetical protein
MPLPLAAAVLIVVPGGTGWYPDRDSWMREEAVVHGWPMPFLWRTPEGWMNVPWKAKPSLPWTLADSARQFLILPLALDIIVAAAGVATFGALVEWRRRRRRRFVQFSLRELLLFVTIVAVILGWGINQRKKDQERRDRFGSIRSMTASFAPRAPLWLQTLVGDESLTSVGFNELSGILMWNSSSGDDIKYLVDRFPGEVGIMIDTAMSSDDVVSISKLDRLESFIRAAPINGRPTDLTRLLACLDKLHNLRELEIYETIDDAAMSRIAKLSRLESLVLSEAGRLTARGLAELQNLKELKRLSLSGAKLTSDALSRLSDLKRLRQLRLDHSTITEGGLAQLARIDDLEEINLYDTKLAGDGIRPLRALRRLRMLRLLQMKVTKADLEAMFEPIDDNRAPVERLKFLDVSRNGIGRGAIKHLEALKHLEVLYLDSAQIDGEAITALQQLPELRRIRVNSGNPTTRRKNQLDLERALPDCEIIIE